MIFTEISLKNWVPSQPSANHSFFYDAFASNLYVGLVLKGMQAGVAAVILNVVCGLGTNVVKEKSILLP